MRTAKTASWTQTPPVQPSLHTLSSIVLASFVLMGTSITGLAQQPMTNRLVIKERGITVRYPSTWSNPPRRFANMDELVNVPVEQLESATPTARIQITVVPRTDHAEAVRELREIARENTSRPAFARLGGWPALQRRHLGLREQPGEGPEF